MSRIIALIPVRNEAWIIERTLRVLSTFCDHIVVADQRSTDGTRQILEKFAPRVKVIDNLSHTHSTKIRWKLLELAREYEGNNFLLLTDADEILSSNIIRDKWLDYFISLPPGTSISLELVNLWRHPHFWRDDTSVWTGRFMEVGFRDDRHTRYEELQETLDHNRRLPAVRRVEVLTELKLLHYQFVLFDRMRCKQSWYRAHEAMEYGIDRAAAINFYYRLTRNEREVCLSPIDPEWIRGWQELGIDLEHFEEEPLYWYDVEVLRYFKEKGPAYFAPVDLWDVDWEQKRQLALAREYESLPEDPIIDLRTWEQKLCHAYLARFQRHPFWRDPWDLPRMPGRWLRTTLRGLEVRRRHLEKIGLHEIAYRLVTGKR